MTPEEKKARIDEINARLDAIETMLGTEGAELTKADGTSATVDELKAEVDALTAEKDKLETEERTALASQLAQKRSARRAAIVAKAPTVITDKKSDFAETRRTKIGAHETRSILLSTGTIATPTGVSGINDPFNVVSSIVDQILIEDMTGMGAVREAYVKSWQSASAKTDGTAQTASDPTFRTSLISPFLLAVTTYVSREFAKKTPLAYEEKVKQGALIALKKKLADWIVSGGGSSEIYGIYNAVNTESTPESMISTLKLTAIGADSLRKIVFGYGGDENVMGGCRLYLNKADLIAFGDVRGTNEKKAVYEIMPDGTNPNTGIIKDGGLAVPYTICSDVTSYTDATATSEGVKTMIYGDPTAYKLGLFGDFEVRVSEDYKFAEGLNTVLGEVMVGGNVVKPNGFEVILKKS